MDNTFLTALGLNKTANISPSAIDLPIYVFDDFLDGGAGKFHTNSAVASLTFDPGTGDSTASLTADSGLNMWGIGGTNATTALVSVVAAPAYPGGWVRLTTAGASADETCILHLTNKVRFGQDAKESRQPWVFRSRVLINTITANSVVVGVGPYNNLNCVETQSASSADFKITNGTVYYQYATSATTVAATALTDENGSNITVAANTFHIFQIEWDGMGTLSYYMDGRLLKTVTPPAFTAANLTVHAGIGDTGGAAKTVDIDYTMLLADPVVGGR